MAGGRHTLTYGRNAIILAESATLCHRSDIYIGVGVSKTFITQALLPAIMSCDSFFVLSSEMMENSETACCRNLFSHRASIMIIPNEINTTLVLIQFI